MTASDSASAAANLPTSPEALLARLEALGIESRRFSHAPVFTVEESKAVCGEFPGAHIKNLFLRNKKGRMWLLSCLEDRRIDLKRLGDYLGSGRLSFASAERLRRHLGVEPGSVTPFAVINDQEGQVQILLDEALLGSEPVNAHPLVNWMTITVAPEGLLRFFEAEGHTPQLIDMSFVEKSEVPVV